VELAAIGAAAQVVFGVVEVIGTSIALDIITRLV
jgi:hypothetical protein